METMTTGHPRWEEFAERLEGPEGCNFRGKDRYPVWDCQAGKDKTFARMILEDMEMDVEKSCAYFEEHGGWCDCEIVFNIIT